MDSNAQVSSALHEVDLSGFLMLVIGCFGFWLALFLFSAAG